MTIKLILKNEANGSAETELLLDELLITIGNSPAATVSLDDAQIAPEQAVIVNENERPLFINQSKRTFYNGQEIEQGVQRELANGDTIEIGGYQLTAILSNNNFLPENEVVAPDNLNGSENAFLASQSQEKIGVQSFADILTSLRKEEDQFYFQLLSESGQQKERIPIQSEELTLGWNAEEGSFSADRENITEPSAIVRKDWSGVTIYPQGDEAILINNAILEAGQRLKNGDRLLFTKKLSQATSREVTLIFCEPAALVELNSILPQQLLSTALETSRAPNFDTRTETVQIATSTVGADASAATGKSDVRNKRFFGFFTLAEILIMIVATILTAALTFLLLELS